MGKNTFLLLCEGSPWLCSSQEKHSCPGLWVQGFPLIKGAVQGAPDPQGVIRAQHSPQGPLPSPKAAPTLPVLSPTCWAGMCPLAARRVTRPAEAGPGGRVQLPAGPPWASLWCRDGLISHTVDGSLRPEPPDHTNENPQPAWLVISVTSQEGAPGFQARSNTLPTAGCLVGCAVSPGAGMGSHRAGPLLLGSMAREPPDQRRPAPGKPRPAQRPAFVLPTGLRQRERPKTWAEDHEGSTPNFQRNGFKE